MDPKVNEFIKKWMFDWREGRILAKTNENLAFYMDPIAFSKVQGKSLFEIAKDEGYDQPEFFILGLLQYRMKVLLEALVNSYDYGLDGRPKSPGYFFTEQVDLETCVECVKELKNFGFSELDDLVSDLTQKFDSKIPIEIIATIVSKFYFCFPNILKKLNPKLRKLTISQPPKIDQKQYLTKDKKYLQPPVVDLANYSNDTLSWAFHSLYVHGSLATLDYIKGSSDFDTFGIVRKEVASSQESLLKLRKDLRKVWDFLYKIDPLQHHGIMTITEQDLEFYPQPFFPPVILNFAKTLYSKNSNGIVFLERDAKFEERHFFYQVVQSFRWRFLNNVGYSDLFSIKLSLSTFMLLPALYYQARSNYMYKKDIFPKLYSEFSKSQLSSLTKVSNIRQENLYLFYSKFGKISNKLERFFKRSSDEGWISKIQNGNPSSKLTSVLGDKIHEEILELSELLYEKRKKDWKEDKSKPRLLENPSTSKLYYSNRPKQYTKKDYENSLKEISTTIFNKVENLDIIQQGDISVPGISDIDLILVLNNSSKSDGVDSLLKSWNELSEQTKYLCYHQPFMIHEEHLKLLTDLWPISNCKNIRTGEDIPELNVSSKHHLFALMEIMIFTDFMEDMFEPLLKKTIDVRNVLVRLYSLTHSITKLEELDVKNDEWRDFRKKVENTRMNWFSNSTEEQNRIIYPILGLSIPVLLGIINELRKLVKNYLSYDQKMNDSQIFGVLNKKLFFVSNWSPSKCLETMDEVFKETGEFGMILPFEFLAIIALYQKNSEIFSRSLSERVIHNLSLEKIKYNSLIFERIEIIESVFKSLKTIGINKIILPVFSIDLSQNTEQKPDWIDSATSLFQSKNISQGIIDYFESVGISNKLSKNIDQLLRGKNYRRVIDNCRNALLKNPNLAKAHYYLAFSLQMSDIQYDEAIDHYNLALKYGFDKFWVLYNRGSLYLEMNMIEDSKNDLKKAYELNPQHEDVKKLLKQIS